ncbi:MAG TPA: hypothetical protein VF066_11245, partial [Thermoleophilaceae bacterium]
MLRRGSRVILASFGIGLLLVAFFIAVGPGSIGPRSAVDRADLANNAITSLGLLAAGVWALFTFVLFRSGITNVEMTIRPHIQPLRSEARLLMIEVGLRNTGKVMVAAGEMGCRVWVRRLPAHAELDEPLDLDSGELVLDGLDLLAN